ncbi:zinc ribbon domain-containing protein, partial [Moraxella osloensis]|uniref:zinc ribbon domain-containing protein n=1 Tax=Faucicola osloensis TaxID=34062 RepID=UPI0024323DBC
NCTYRSNVEKFVLVNTASEIVNERYTTQRCSCCGEITANSPKGRKSLGIREWICASCGTWHDRDINASKNILAVGLDRLVEGIPLL